MPIIIKTIYTGLNSYSYESETAAFPGEQIFPESGLAKRQLANCY